MTVGYGRRVKLSPAEALFLAVTLFAVIFVSVLGILLGLLGALHGHYEGSRTWTVVCLALAAVALGLELARL
jgi:hypothetical protein